MKNVILGLKNKIDFAILFIRYVGIKQDYIRVDTQLKNFPLYCPKCKQESLINAKNLQVFVIKEYETDI